MAIVARELRQFVAKSLYSLDWSKDESLLLYWSKIYVPNIIDLHRRVVTLYHNLKVAEHLGRLNTLELVVADVKVYKSIC